MHACFCEPAAGGPVCEQCVPLCVLWVETEVLLLQKYSQTSQVFPTTSGYIIKGRVTGTLFGLVNFKTPQISCSTLDQFANIKQIKVSAKLACWGSVCVMSVSHENFCRTAIDSYDKSEPCYLIYQL